MWTLQILASLRIKAPLIDLDESIAPAKIRAILFEKQFLFVRLWWLTPCEFTETCCLWGSCFGAQPVSGKLLLLWRST